MHRLLTIARRCIKQTPLQPEQIAPLALLGRVPNVLMVNPARHHLAWLN
jgi:hypothetical protein